jgi:NAD(P)-dependent dehydrogenase (short-subunit alcohol dehydrogenase family)
MVFAGCRSYEKASGLKDLAAQHPELVKAVPLDVTDLTSIVECVQLVAARVDSLDILINNAAVHMGDENLSAAKSEVMLKTLQVNAVGPILASQQFIPLLKKGKQPRIINISSEAGSITRMDHFRGYGYYGSKAAENMYTRSLAFDPETDQITVIALHPGWVRTDMGGPEAPLSASASAAGILNVVVALTPQDNGKFYTWEGIEYPW